MDKPLILSLDAHGVPHRWISWQQACFYYANNLVACTLGGSTFLDRNGVPTVIAVTSIGIMGCVSESDNTRVDLHADFSPVHADSAFGLEDRVASIAHEVDPQLLESVAVRLHHHCGAGPDGDGKPRLPTGHTADGGPQIDRTFP